MALFTYDLAEGKAFIAHNRLEPQIDAFRGLTEEQFRGWFFDRFRESYLAKRPELERMKLCELYYAGFHYSTPQANRDMKVTNLCFSTVETVHPVMTEMRPRPEIIPRRQYQPGEVDTLQQFAEWLMDTTEFDLTHDRNTREKLKLGWCVHLLVVDPRTGICFPKPYSTYDFYPNAGATSEDDMEFFFLAQPVPTEWLREKYPHLADRIVSDNIASPSYDVLVKPYYEQYGMGGDYSGLDDIVVSGGAHLEGEADPGGARALIPAEQGTREFAGTTFLLRGMFRDRRTMPVHYSGDIATKNDDGISFTHTPCAKNLVLHEPYCKGGWCSVAYTADGLLLDQGPVDPCFLGAPVEIGRDYAQLGRFYGIGELDFAIPINRSINKRYTLLNRSLEYEAVPILVADTDAGSDLDRRAVEPGDVLRKMRGSDIRWLDFRGAASQQFELLALEGRDMDTVTGVHDVQQGRRPEGIEAAAAIRNLQNAAQTRIRGKEVPSHIEYSRLLKKMMVATGKKAKGPIFFRANGGATKSIDPALLCEEYDIRFAQGSGTALGRATNEEKNLQLYSAGLIDQQTAMEKLNVPNIPVVLQRLQAQATIAAQSAQANATASKGAAA